MVDDISDETTTPEHMLSLPLDTYGAAVVIEMMDGGEARFSIIDTTDEETGHRIPMKIALGLAYLASHDPKLVTEAYSAAMSELQEDEPEWAEDVKGSA